MHAFFHSLFLSSLSITLLQSCDTINTTRINKGFSHIFSCPFTLSLSLPLPHTQTHTHTHSFSPARFVYISILQSKKKCLGCNTNDTHRLWCYQWKYNLRKLKYKSIRWKIHWESSMWKKSIIGIHGANSLIQTVSSCTRESDIGKNRVSGKKRVMSHTIHERVHCFWRQTLKKYVNIQKSNRWNRVAIQLKVIEAGTLLAVL